MNRRTTLFLRRNARVVPGLARLISETTVNTLKAHAKACKVRKIVGHRPDRCGWQSSCCVCRRNRPLFLLSDSHPVFFFLQDHVTIDFRGKYVFLLIISSAMCDVRCALLTTVVLPPLFFCFFLLLRGTRHPQWRCRPSATLWKAQFRKTCGFPRKPWTCLFGRICFRKLYFLARGGWNPLRETKQG